MAETRPFRGIRYTHAPSEKPGGAGDLALNLCPPFDVITQELQKELYERSPFNIVRLELARRGLTEDPYLSAAETQREWMASGVLRRDEEPSVYVTEETFEFAGQRLVRGGVITAVRLEEYDREVVLPHENTRTEWVNDRVRLMGAAQANYSPLLMVYRDDMRSTVGGIVRAVAGGQPTLSVKPPDMSALRMWRVTDPGTQQVISDSLADSQLFIADGHHRYEAALRYRSLIRSGREVGHNESINYRMVLLVSVDEPGLITRGYHRAIVKPAEDELGELKRLLRTLFNLEPWSPQAGPAARSAGGSSASRPGGSSGGSTREIAVAFADALGGRRGSEVVFGVIGLEPGSYHIATARDLAPARDLLEDSEYSRLHDLVINPAIATQRRDGVVDVQHDLVRVLESVQSGEAAIAFAMRPVPMQEFIGIVTRGWRLPPKATNFFPKPSAGAVLQTLEGDL
ncbi:MAG: DUF1015 domain-containing protein [Chloroflexi bacterium]|nr:DUF1015 domain-containing protein [Chloroflexota bacterium]